MEVKAGYKQTEIGIIPEDWDVGILEKYCYIIDCKHITADFIENGIPVASIREVQSRFIDLENAKQTTQAYYLHLIEGGRKPQVGDLIFSRNATVGETAQVADWHPVFAIGQDVCIIRKRIPDFSSDYIQDVIRSGIVINQLSSLMAGSTFKRVNVQQIKNFIIPMPKAKEQEAISEALSDADALIEALEQLIAKKRQVKQGAMQELLTGKKRLVESGKWEVKRLGDIATFYSGGTPSTENAAYYDGEIPWITSSDLNKGFINDVDGRITKLGLENSSAKMVNANTLLVALYGATAGVTAITRLRAAINQAVLAVIPNRDNYTFLFYKLGYLKDWIITTYTQGGQPNLSGEIVKSIEITLPEPNEQTAIAEILSDMDAEIAALEGKLSKAREVKQGMMSMLLTGKIRLVESGK